MGMPSIPQMLIILAIVIVIFGGKKITNLVTDLGHSIKGFREATKELESDD